MPPPPPSRAAPDAGTSDGCVVALDLGGTEVKGALVDRSARPVHAESRPTNREAGVEAVVGAVEAFGAELVERAGRDRVRAVGLVVPGLVDGRNGVARYSVTLGWRDLPLRDRFSASLGLPVVLDHDVRAGALAEGLLGAARGCGDFLFLPVGTGIAGGMVLDGHPYAGSGTAAGEIGHTPVSPGGERCTCGQYGCLEVYASAAGVVRRYLAASGTAVRGPDDVVQRASSGDEVAARVWKEAVDALATALASYTLLLDPDLVVIGGGMAGAGRALFEPLGDRLRESLAWRPPPRLVPAELGARAGCLGAAVVAWRLAGEPVEGDSAVR
ncbi:MAG: glucokinase [Nocardioidaceae bacterium]|nr:glucokinase [Nocardioidaceae bacterium]